MTRLTEHFTVEEMCRSNTATRLGIHNVCPADFLPNLLMVATNLELLRNYYDQPIHVLSGYRCPDLNKAVGGSKTSAHRFGMACDFTVEGESNLAVCKDAARILKDFDQIIYEFGESGWVHIGFAGVNRQQTLTAVKRDGKTVYLPGFVEGT